MRKLYRFASLLTCVTALGIFSAQAQYCTPQFSTGCAVGDQIENFSTTGGITNITNNNSGCSSGNYSHITNQTLQVNLGSSFNFSIQAGSAYSQGHRIWIDWNDDNDFTDPGEDMWNSGTYSTAVYTGSITVPLTASPGKNLRMRTRCSYVAVPSDPCAQQSYGEVEDYNVFVIPPVANDAGIAAINSPAPFSCDLSDSIIVTLSCSGTDSLTSATIHWQINQGTPQSTNWTGLVPALGTFGPVFLGTGTFTDGDVLKVWTSNPNTVPDSFPANDTITTTLLEAIGGTFTVGGSNPDYATIDSATSDLYFRGMCSAVVLKIRAGVYNGQVVIGEINGASTTNTLTLEPDTGIVTIEANPSSSDNFVVKLDGADHVIFNDLIIQVGSSAGTYARVIDLNNGATYNEFNNCQINGYSNATTSDRQATIYTRSSGNNYNKFMNNEINGGSYGVYFWGGSTTSSNENCEFVGNSFKDAYYRGLYVYYSEDLIFNYNKLESNTTYLYGYGFMSYYSNGASEVKGNHLSWPGYCAMYLYQYNGNANNFPVVANNMVNSGAASYYTYGAYIYGGFMQIVHNTIVKNSGASYGYYGIYVSGGGNTVMNNIIYDPAGLSSYYTLYYSGGFAVLESDYNDIYSGGTQNFGYFNGIQSSLLAWQTTTGMDMNSVTTDPGFTNYDSLRTCNDTLDGAGTPVSFVAYDYDGDDRDPVTPDIGADEFVGSAPGSYSAGPDAIVCDGKTVEIGLQVTGGSFLWSNSETTSTISVSTPGTYLVTMITDCGATHIDTVEVIDETPTASFNKSTSYVTGSFINTSLKGNSSRWVVQVAPFDTLWSTDLTYVFPDVGPYQVCLTTYNDCDTVQTCDVWEGYVPIGIEESNLSDMISLMPNPVSDNLTVQFKGMESNEVNVELTNVQGQVVYNTLFDNVSGNTSETIDVSALKKGMYIVKFTTENEVSAKRIIVQ